MRKLIAIAFTLVLAACAASPVAQYFVLKHPGESGDRIPESSNTIVAIAPVLVPDYVNRSQIVTTGRNGEVLVHEYARWAEPLGDGIQRSLIDHIDRSSSDATPVRLTSGIRASLILRTHVERMDVSLESGQSVMVVEWRLLDASGNTVVGPRRSAYDSDTGGAIAIGQVSEQTDALISAFAEDIGQAIDEWSASNG